ncbi:MAG: hypothetical protein JWQ40_4324 [Segetibacter sp.]|jgi:hypothetical protein|nr:hypothetical protein [Segetibacter sp.]
MFDYAKQQSDVRLEASLDKNEYDESELVTIKIPITLPYQNNWDDFERVDGEFTVDGKIYKYVKRKIADGHLVLLCLPDHNKMRLESAKTEFFKYANDLVQNHNSKKSDNSKSGVFKNLWSEYDSNTMVFTAANFNSEIIHAVAGSVNLFPSSPHSSPEQPPEII